MNDLLATNILWGALVAFYVFGIIPAIGHMLGTSPKPHWVGYDYEPCMGRGLIAHAILFIIYIVLKAIIVKLFY